MPPLPQLNHVDFRSLNSTDCEQILPQFDNDFIVVDDMVSPSPPPVENTVQELLGLEVGDDNNDGSSSSFGDHGFDIDWSAPLWSVRRRPSFAMPYI